MPSASGIEVARELEASDAPVIVFVTAFDSYALDAFSVHACDYLLKPFDGKRFRQSAQRAITRAAQRRAAEQNVAIRRLLANASALPVAASPVAAGAARPQSLERIAVKNEGRAHLVATRDVDWIEAVGSSCLLHVGGSAHRVAQSISQLEASLPSQFARINRSTIVNLDQIRELQQLFHGRYTVVLRNGTELSLSRRYRRRARVLSDGL
jgi:two-component system LytT family response regulator